MKTSPRMNEIAIAIQMAVEDLGLPMMGVQCDDNMCSSVVLNGSYDAREDWTNNIWQNSRHFQFYVSPAKNTRYYDPEADPRISVEINQKSRVIERKFRKYTGPVDKVIARIVKWIAQNDPITEGAV